MTTIKNFSETAIRGWNDSTPAARFGLIILVIVFVILLGLVGYWSSQPSFVTLVSDVDHEKMANVVDALDKAGIQYEVGGAGGILRVDKRSFAKARLIARGQGVSSDSSEPDSMVGGIWLDPTDRKNLENRKRESNLRSTIEKYDSVESADVHLNIPARGPFERRVSSPSASVMLTLSPNQRLSSENVIAIADLVAYAVQDLEPKEVRISDKKGNVYSVPDDMSADINRQIDFTTQVERKLERKAERMLAQFVGYGNANVQISLDLTFKQSEKNILDVEPEGKVATDESIKTETKKQEKLGSNGAGVQANLETGNSPSRGLAQDDTTETITNTYIVPQTKQIEINNTPIRNFMTVSVLVNELAPGLLLEDGALNPEMQDRIQQMVANAIGFRQDTDEMSVVFQKFATDETAEMAAPPFDWTPVNEILRNVSLALAAIVALAILFITMRRFQKQAQPPQVQIDSGKSANINQLNELAKTNPEIFAKILQSWSGNEAADKTNAVEATETKKAA